MEQKMDGWSESGLSRDWTELTHDCLINILSRLSLEDRWRRAMRVCKCWLQACKEPCLNSAFNLEPHFHPYVEFADWYIPTLERKIDFILRSVVVWSDGSLTEVRVRLCSDHSLSLSLVAQSSFETSLYANTLLYRCPITKSSNSLY